MSLTPASIRRDKKCGASGIPDNAKCTKGTGTAQATPNTPGRAPKKRASNPPDILNTIRAGIGTLGMAGYTLEAADLYKKSGGNPALLAVGLGAAGATYLQGKAAVKFAQGKSSEGYLNQLGSVASLGAGLGGAYAVSNWQEAQRKRRAETGYTGSDPFKDLGISKNASPEEIRKAYLKRAQAAHPDQGGSNEAMAKVNAAYKEALRQVGGRSKRPGRTKPSPAPTSSSPRGRFLSPGRGDSIWAFGFAPVYQ